jgi:hypothetical protein
MHYYEHFEPSSTETVIDRLMSEFQEPAETFDGCEILFAVYETPDYEGYAFVLFAKDGVLYEVNGSHCSCYGLEGQWEPEKVNAQELVNRTGTSSYGVVPQFGKEIVEVVTAFLWKATITGQKFSISEFFEV